MATMMRPQEVVRKRKTLKAKPQPDRSAIDAGRDFVERYPVVMARLAE